MDDLRIIRRFLRAHWILILALAAIATLVYMVAAGLNSPQPLEVAGRMYGGWLWIALIIILTMIVFAFNSTVHTWSGGAQNARGHARMLGNWLVRWIALSLLVALAVFGWQHFGLGTTPQSAPASRKPTTQVTTVAQAPVAQPTAALSCPNPSKFGLRECAGSLTTAWTDEVVPAEGDQDGGLTLCANDAGVVEIHSRIRGNHIAWKFRLNPNKVGQEHAKFRYGLFDLGTSKTCADVI